MNEEYKQSCANLIKALEDYLNDDSRVLGNKGKVIILNPNGNYKTKVWIEKNPQGDKRIRFNDQGMGTLSLLNKLLLNQLELVLLDQERVDEAYQNLKEQGIIY